MLGPMSTLIPTGPATVPETPWAIEATGLCKIHRHWSGRMQRALQSVDLRVRRGTVHGFLGPNGAGKSTTIRALLGLTRCSGRMSILGYRVPEHLPAVIDRVGAIVERPRFPGEFSGRRNLLQIAHSLGRTRRDVDRVLDTTDLHRAADTRYKAYSLGMKQRLAIAAALLTEPELIILDEPTNGLDPQGIADVRRLTRQLASEGRTVLISSHLLHEVQQIADDITIINAGTTVAAGPLSALAQGRMRWRVRLADHLQTRDRAASVLRHQGWEVTGVDQDLLVAGDEPGHAITRTLAAEGLWIDALTLERTGLEETFLRLTTPGLVPGDLPPGPVTTNVDPHQSPLR